MASWPELFQRYQQLVKKDPDLGLLAFLRTEEPWCFAHHPEHRCFEEHVWKWAGLYWCKGCVMSWLGIALGLLGHSGALALGYWWMRDYATLWIAVVFVGLLVPTLLTALLPFPRAIKHLSRIGLGVLVASALCYAVLAPWSLWWTRVVIVVVYFGVRIPMDRMRQMRNLRELQIARGGIK